MRLIVGVLAGVLLLAGPVAAQPSGPDRAALRITEAIELPGMTLPPGEYELKVLENGDRRALVQVQEQTTGKILATLLSVPAERTRASETTVVPFTSARPDIPQPIRYWYLPGAERGFELVYPREQAVAIAASTGERVLTAETTTTASMRTVRVTAVDADGRRVSTADRHRVLDVPRVALNTTPELPARTTPAIVEEPAGARRPKVPPRAAAIQQTPAPSAPAPPAQAAPVLDELPDTAGTTVAILLVGLVCLVAALALMFRRRHV
ncbi:MAG TPA: LPXTG cell wall anchor domain-containing protein [Vicinamibacterales bacterium]